METIMLPYRLDIQYFSKKVTIPWHWLYENSSTVAQLDDKWRLKSDIHIAGTTKWIYQSTLAFCVFGTAGLAKSTELEEIGPQETSSLQVKKILVNPQHVLLPPLHIKLGMMKQLVKALNKEIDCFEYLCGVFQALSTEKLRAEIFDGP